MKEVNFLSENKLQSAKEVKIGYYSMGLSSVLAGVLLVLNQLNYKVYDGVYILWPVMMILLGLEIILTKAITSIKNPGYILKPSWAIILICCFLVACSQVWMMAMDLRLY
ncbi:MAG: hypothetical protein JXN65_00065 [Clostridia bacterium]|nr:hypothetical protein [Clostridia bacterium]